MRLPLIVVLLIAGCSDPDPPAGQDAAVDAAVDADPNAPDAPPSSCPHTAEQPFAPPASPPSGNWAGQWRCVSNCATPPVDDFARTTSLQISGNTLTWRGPDGISIMTTARADGSCWRVPRDDSRCGAEFNVCPAACGTASCVTVQFAAWYDENTGRWQMWEFRAPRA